MFLILIVVVHSFPSVLYLTFPLLSLRWWVNRDHIDGFLSCNNQSKRREEDCRGLERLKRTVTHFIWKWVSSKREKFATYLALSCIAPLWDDWSACFMSLPLLLGKNGATAVLVIFMFLLELKDVLRLCGLRILYLSTGIISEFLIITLLMRLIFLIPKINKAFHLTAAKWSIKAIKR